MCATCACTRQDFSWELEPPCHQCSSYVLLGLCGGIVERRRKKKSPPGGGLLNAALATVYRRQLSKPLENTSSGFGAVTLNVALLACVSAALSSARTLRPE